MLRLDSKDVGFINLLKVFENDLAKIPWRNVKPACHPISAHLKKIFTVYFNIYSMTDVEVERMLNIISRHTRNSDVKNLILTEIVWTLRDSDSYQHQAIGQHFLNKFIFKID